MSIPLPRFPSLFSFLHHCSYSFLLSSCRWYHIHTATGESQWAETTATTEDDDAAATWGEAAVIVTEEDKVDEEVGEEAEKDEEIATTRTGGSRRMGRMVTHASSKEPHCEYDLDL